MGMEQPLPSLLGQLPTIQWSDPADLEAGPSDITQLSGLLRVGPLASVEVQTQHQ